eukprot:comp19475_c0_seq1/m.22675 comp19475_c0_seq1/g.22675  ORF comp19475_c0_seq1/g.22675 comp19475_c0_seq1/m.22675 type:complete len:369 (-) comp19475_c0_seq1:187-1293(-)
MAAADNTTTQLPLRRASTTPTVHASYHELSDEWFETPPAHHCDTNRHYSSTTHLSLGRPPVSLKSVSPEPSKMMNSTKQTYAYKPKNFTTCGGFMSSAASSSNNISVMSLEEALYDTDPATAANANTQIVSMCQILEDQVPNRLRRMMNGKERNGRGFVGYLVRHYVDENYEFFREIDEFLSDYCAGKGTVQRAEGIYMRFLSVNTEFDVSISPDRRNRIEHHLYFSPQTHSNTYGKSRDQVHLADIAASLCKAHKEMADWLDGKLQEYVDTILRTSADDVSLDKRASTHSCGANINYHTVGSGYGNAGMKARTIEDVDDRKQSGKVRASKDDMWEIKMSWAWPVISIPPKKNTSQNSLPIVQPNVRG